MEAETRHCQNCKKDFIIEPDDFGFYEKIKVPPPTFCWRCRYIRRLLDRNEYNFYKRKCDATGKDIISIYRPDAPFPVYQQEYWKSDKFDATKYSRDFDFSKLFFEQYEELRNVVPHLALVNSSSVNSEYTNQSQDNKECYMLVSSGRNEKCMYGNWLENCHFMADCCMADKSEFCYESLNIQKCSHCAWIYNCSDCVNVYFSSDCRGCTDCFGCVGLRGQQYCYFNENIGKEAYEARVKKVVCGREFIQQAKENFLKLYKTLPVKFYHGINAKNCSGDYIRDSQNGRFIFNCGNNKDTAYMQDAWLRTEDCLDCTEIIEGQLSYECQGVVTPHRSIAIRSGFNTITDSYYCDMCFNVQDCLGCFGLKQKKHCILNKQYTKDEYLKIKEKIIEYMQKTGEWGEYFPAKYSPFAYNESMAQDYFPLKKEEALKTGYTWYDRPERDYEATLLTKDLPKTFSETKEDIINEVIQCSSQNFSKETEKYPLCMTAFKITPLEFSLYKILKIPVPEKCFPCRRQDRFKFRNPRKLWHKKCMKEGCQNEFETSYAPEREEKVYCEPCYNKEVY